jgi:hypothetical protein
MNDGYTQDSGYSNQTIGQALDKATEVERAPQVQQQMEVLRMEVDCAQSLADRLGGRLQSILRVEDECKDDSSVPEEMLTKHADQIRDVSKNVRLLNNYLRRILDLIEL